MKGAEIPHIAIAIILIVIVIAIVLFLLLSVGGPTQAQETIDFKEFCLYWSLHRYREGLNEEIQIGGYSASVYEQCQNSLGKYLGVLDEDDLEKCRDNCRLITNEPTD